ncbi:hypothetical protein TELCIR_24039 [Teladorsagia circumcincta]|uniref:Secreted protein n=1 Tax=Teladorsagia circumcincta TaxID=45464 RepID=A0A2G9T9E7_TELCI|nr:hypothetical protein TELCIR_24039 [Teladorsagia circumcincta]
MCADFVAKALPMLAVCRSTLGLILVSDRTAAVTVQRRLPVKATFNHTKGPTRAKDRTRVALAEGALFR